MIARFCFSFLCLLLSQSVFAAQFQVLLFSKTAGWHHQSINAGVDAITKLSKLHNFGLEWNENADWVMNDKYLDKFDLIIFLNTTGDVLNDKQQGAMERFIQAGKGFVGIHAASDTEYDWPWYAKLVGRNFVIHPSVQTAKVTVEKRGFPGLEWMPDQFLFTDEWYEFGKEHTKGLNYLLTIDEKTYDPKVDWGNGMTGEGMGKFHPIAWYHEYDGGRSFYTAMGHMPATFESPVFTQHLYGGIYWAATGKGITSKK